MQTQKHSTFSSVAKHNDSQQSSRRSEGGRSEGAISNRFPLQRPFPGERIPERTGTVDRVTVLPAAKQKFFAGYVSRMVEQLVNDFALAAAATHPEAFLMMSSDSEYDDARYDRPAKSREDNWSNLHRQSENSAKQGSRYRHEMRTQSKLPARIADGRKVAAPAPADSDAGWGGWVMSLASSLQSKFQDARQMRRDLAALQSLDDRMLKDIGVSRYDVERVVRHGRSKD
ncbi:MAG TPA: DUF1127 domain-containing protein [Dongiaceae bacterium]|nr:DUF1127 domain-containing protein [Dongiaceae bacterium]